MQTFTVDGVFGICPSENAVQGNNDRAKEYHSGAF